MVYCVDTDMESGVAIPPHNNGWKLWLRKSQ